MELSAEKQNYIASIEDTIEDAWTRIESNRHRSVVVVDGDKVVGTLSDGDLRKAMLAKRLLSTPIREVMNVNFISLIEGERHDADKVFKRVDIFLIPIVDENFKLIDIIIK